MQRAPNQLVRRVPAFVPLLAAYPIVFLATANQGQVTWAITAVSTVVSITVALVAFGLLRLISHSKVSAGTATVLLIVMFFSYGLVTGAIDSLVALLRFGDNEAPNPLDARPMLRTMIAVVWGLFAVVAAWFVARASWTGSSQLSRTLTFAGCALLVLSFAAPAAGWMRAVASSDHAAPAIVTTQRVAPASKILPDIYFIVLDGYARADVLARYYDFQNTEFLEGLRTRGFQVAVQSAANYNWTFLSLSSTLNMDYLENVLSNKDIQDKQDRTAAYESIRNSATAEYLRKRGYRVVHLQSTWGATSINPYADKQVRCEHSIYTNEFVRAVAEASWLSAFHSKAGVDLAQCHMANFKALSEMGSEPGPKFVFAHFLLPHHPYLFDRDGKVLRNASISNQFEFQKRLWEDKASYRSQLEYVNRKVLESIDGIVAGSAQRPIIVLESDHGPSLAQGLSKGAQVGARLANFGAYLLPSAPKGLIPSNGSAVNQFRIILSHYFGADLKPLPDRHFVSPYGAPYQLADVPRAKLIEIWRTSLAPDPGQTASVGNIKTNHR